MVGSRQPYVKLASPFYIRQSQCPRLPRPLGTLKRPSTISHNFLLWTLLGYSILRFPLFATICSAVNGRLVNLHLESAHHCLTAFTSSWYLWSSWSNADILESCIVATIGEENNRFRRQCSRGAKGSMGQRTMMAIENGSCGVLVNIDHKLLTVRKERLGLKAVPGSCPQMG